MAKTEEQFNDQTLSGTIPVNEQNLLQEFLQTVVLDDLNDVNISSPVSGQVIGYNSGTNSWQNLNASIVDGDKGDITTSAGGNTWTIDNNAITTAKINNDAVTTAKILNSNVTTAKIADNAVTNAKLAQVATATVKGRATAGTGNVEDLAIDSDLSSVSANDDTIPSAKATKAYVDILDLKTRIRNGGLINGYIIPSVTSNNLTLSLSTSPLSVVAPTSTNPVYIWINGVLEIITSALTATANAGTNWFGSGASELAAQSIDYFAYIGKLTSGGALELGFARLPSFRLGSEASTTTTNEKYIRFSTGTSPANFTEVVNIGRFAATLGAFNANPALSYLWTIPTYTAITLVQEPIFEGRMPSYLPTYGGSGSLTYTTVTTTTAKYQVMRNRMFLTIDASGVTGGTTNHSITATLPFTVIGEQSLGVTIRDATSGQTTSGVCGAFGNQLFFRKFDASNWGLGSSRIIRATGVLEI